MTTIRRYVLATIACAALVTALGVPASAGDIGAPLRGPVGDWQTRTNGVAQTITFAKDGRVYGDSGCNRFTGAYKVVGDRITIGPLASTMMACPQRQMDAEATFLTRVQAAVGYHATKRVLKLFAPKDMVRFVRTD